MTAKSILAVALFSLAIQWGDTAAASDPATKVEFDLPSSIECVVISSKTDEPTKLVEIKFKVDIRIKGQRSSVKQIDIEFMGLHSSDVGKAIKIQKITPAKLGVVETDGNIMIVEETQANMWEHRGQGRVFVGRSGIAGDTKAVGEAVGKKLTVTSTLKAPEKLVLTSGTTEREYGGYVSLFPTKLTHLEGQHEFAVRVEVPQTWRGDALSMKMQAGDGTLAATNWFGKKIDGPKRFGSRVVVIGTYIQGEQSAKASAESLANATSVIEREAATGVTPEAIERLRNARLEMQSHRR